MALLYRIKQFRDVLNQADKWHAKAVMIGTSDTRDLASIIQRNCTVKKADVLAVLNELVEVMKDELQSSNRVKLDGFGTFKLTIEGTGVETLEDFNPNQNIKGVKVLFQPETTVNKDKTRNKLFCSDCQVQEVPDYEEPTEETEAGGA